MNIQQLSQETGIGIDTLRIWERRYGFPVPARDARGHRRYTLDQVEELRMVRKLQSAGYRPGKIFSLQATERRTLLNEILAREIPEEQHLRRLLGTLSPEEIEAELGHQLQRRGLEEFIHRFAVPLLRMMDHGWTEGRLSIAREHLLSDQLETLLRAELAVRQPGGREGKILFLTLNGERHKLGLLLAAALFQRQGADCLVIQDDLPLSEIPRLVEELNAAAVALSFSAHYATRQAKQDLASLRRSLAGEIRMIAGGAAVPPGLCLPNVSICSSLEQIPEIYARLFQGNSRNA